MARDAQVRIVRRMLKAKQASAFNGVRAARAGRQSESYIEDEY